MPPRTSTGYDTLITAYRKRLDYERLQPQAVKVNGRGDFDKTDMKHT